MKILVIGDIHIDDPWIPEIKTIFGEIFQIKAEGIILLGDVFHKNRPTPLEIDFATDLMLKIKKKYKDITVLTGTGRHEFVNGIPIVKYFRNLGVKVIEGEYRTEIDGKKIFCGHFMLNESKLAFGSGKYGLKDLKKYDIVLLGHQHLTIDKFHLGSIRYVSWQEVEDKFKRVALIENGELEFIKLKTPIAMVDVYSPKELEKLDKSRKVRLIIKNWEDYKNWINDFSKWKEKFQEFTYKLLYEPIQEVIFKDTKNISFRDKIDGIENKEIRGILKEEFIEEGLL